MPLRVIREALESAGGDVGRLRAVADSGDSLIDRVLAPLAERVSEADVLDRYDIPARALARLAELGVLSPDESGYTQAEVRVIEAIARFRAAGWNETTGFGARDVARLMKGLDAVVADELELLLQRFAALDPDRAGALLDGGATPFPDLIGALHAKALTDELERQRSVRKPQA